MISKVKFKTKAKRYGNVSHQGLAMLALRKLIKPADHLDPLWLNTFKTPRLDSPANQTNC